MQRLSMAVACLLFAIVFPAITPVQSAPRNGQQIVDFDLEQQQIISTHITPTSNLTASSGFPPSLSPDSHEVTPFQVIGPDDTRTRIPNTALYPWSAVAQIEFIDPNNVINTCSGWMLGRSTVVTAGHCVYLMTASGGSNGWGRSYRIRPGLDGSLVRWECTGFHAHVPQEWIDAINNGQGRDEPSFAHDFAGIDLRCRVGEVTGVLGFRSTNHSDLDQQAVSVTGYPGDHPPPPGDEGTSMWTGGGNLVAGTVPGVLRYTVDTTGGQSGGPIWQTENIPNGCSNPCVVGGDSSAVDDGITPNFGFRITPAVLSEFVLWKQYEYTIIYTPLLVR